MSMNTIPKVTLKVINQNRMFFVDFSVNCQPIFMKFGNNYISTESGYPWKIRKIIYRISKLDHLTCNKLKLRRPSINPLN